MFAWDIILEKQLKAVLEAEASSLVSFCFIALKFPKWMTLV